MNGHSRFFYYVIPAFPWYPHPTLPKIYQDWDIGQFEGQPAISPPPSAAHVPGAQISVWADRPTLETPETVAANLQAPLRALAQRTWHDVRPSLTVAQFQQVVDDVAGAP